MKIKTILSLALLGMVTAVNSAPYNAIGAGSSTIGTTGSEDYASLNAAVVAVNAALTRDASTWTFLIATDLTEPNNSFLGVTVDPAGAIVFKPAPTTAPVITFTRTNDNAATSGNLIIGTSLDSNLLSADTPTRNITIDGSNAANGTTRDLTITNSSTIVHSFSSLIAIFGDSDFITVKNTNIINANSGIVGNVSGLSVRPRYETPNFGIPDNTVIENNLIRSIGSQQGVAINVNSSGVATGLSGWVGYSVRNNVLEGRIRGMFMNPAGAGNITGNAINIGGGGTTNGFGTFGVIWNGSVASPAGAINVLNNDVNIVTDNHTQNVGPTGLFLGSLQAGAVINVVNNEIALESNPTVSTSSDSGIQLLARGVFTSSGLPFNLYHNSIRVKVNGNVVGSQAAQQNYAFGGYALAGTLPTLLNNVASLNVPGGAVVNQNVVPSSAPSDYNILSASNGADTYARRRNAFTFHNRQVASGVATISIGSGTTAQAHTLLVGDQVLIAPTLSVNMNNRAITGGVATITTGTGTTAQAHTFVAGDRLYVNATVGAGGAPNIDLDGVRTISAVGPSTISFATTGSDLVPNVNGATVGNLTRILPAVNGGPYAITAVTTSSFSFATASADVSALVTAATQGNVWVYDIAAATVRFPGLAAWQTAATQDINSDVLNPDAAGAAPDTGKWTSASSLRLDGKPGLADTWGAPPVAPLADATAAAAQLTDIDGQTRTTTGTIYRGADELVGSGLDLPVSEWAMY